MRLGKVATSHAPFSIHRRLGEAGFPAFFYCFQLLLAVPLGFALLVQLDVYSSFFCFHYLQQVSETDLPSAVNDGHLVVWKAACGGATFFLVAVVGCVVGQRILTRALLLLAPDNVATVVQVYVELAALGAARDGLLHI